MITSTTYILLLVLPGALGTVPANPQSGSDSVKLADILTKGSWAHVVPLGPIVIETCTLTFRADGHVREEIGDDTGLHYSYGIWALERTDDGDVLRLSDELRYHGRFSIKYLEKEKAFDLRIGSGSTERLLRFESLKTSVTRT